MEVCQVWQVLIVIEEGSLRLVSSEENLVAVGLEGLFLLLLERPGHL